MNDFLKRLQNILTSFLGEPKHDVTENGQIQFACPRCVDDYGEKEKSKFNLECNFFLQRFNCWKCSSTHDEMHGSIIKLIKLYGNSTILKEYINVINEFKKSKLYELKFDKENFNIDLDGFSYSDVKLPNIYHKFNKNGYNPKAPLQYLFDRGIGWDIIEEYKIGYTDFDRNQKDVSTRIILPSYNEYDELNYWTGRDYTNLPFKQKYMNPIVERKDIIFNENKIQWDADITLCEGPFDHIVIPNSIPLLGKSLKPNYEIFNKLMLKANANINIFLDGDAVNDVKKIYKTLNQGRLQGKIRYIPVQNTELDPSEIYKIYGKRGIIQYLKCASKFNEIELNL